MVQPAPPRKAEVRGGALLVHSRTPSHLVCGSTPIPSSQPPSSSLPHHLILTISSHLVSSHPHLISSPPHLTFPTPSALVAASIVDAHEGLLEWIKTEIETVVTDVRVAQVRDEITSLAIGFITLEINYDELVKLLGGREPTESGSVNKSGAWGSTLASSADNTSSYITDVPEAMIHADAILPRLWIEVAGCDPVSTGGVGLKAMAKTAVAHLTPEHCKLFFVDFFTRIALAAHRMRSRRTVDPTSGEQTLPLVSFAALAAESVRHVQDPLIAKQASKADVDARLAEIAAAVAAASAKAGAKRPLSAPAATATPAAAATPTATPGKRKARTPAAAPAAAASSSAATGPIATIVSAGTAPSAPAPSPAPDAPEDGWTTPTWAVGSIISLSKKLPGSGSAVQHFNAECTRLAVTNFPCAIQALTGSCRGAAGGCRTCRDQAALPTGPTPVPIGLVARIKRSADPDTAKRIV
jgi:hypothetical protein